MPIREVCIVDRRNVNGRADGVAVSELGLVVQQLANVNGPWDLVVGLTRKTVLRHIVFGIEEVALDAASPGSRDSARVPERELCWNTEKLPTRLVGDGWRHSGPGAAVTRKFGYRSAEPAFRRRRSSCSSRSLESWSGLGPHCAACSESSRDPGDVGCCC